jgi:hypothetical protein
MLLEDFPEIAIKTAKHDAVGKKINIRSNLGEKIVSNPTSLYIEIYIVYGFFQANFSKGRLG